MDLADYESRIADIQDNISIIENATNFYDALNGIFESLIVNEQGRSITLSQVMLNRIRGRLSKILFEEIQKIEEDVENEFK